MIPNAYREIACPHCEGLAIYSTAPFHRERPCTVGGNGTRLVPQRGEEAEEGRSETGLTLAAGEA